MAKTKNIDDAVMQMLKTVEKKKKEIQALKQKPQWLTNCCFWYDADAKKVSERVNIGTQRDTQTLVDFYAFLCQREQYLRQTADELNITVELSHLGYPIAAWKTDLKTRIGQLSIEQKQAELAELDKRVNAIVSVDQRREMELQALQAALRDE